MFFGANVSLLQRNIAFAIISAIGLISGPLLAAKGDAWWIMAAGIALLASGLAGLITLVLLPAQLEKVLSGIARRAGSHAEPASVPLESWGEFVARAELDRQPVVGTPMISDGLSSQVNDNRALIEALQTAFAELRAGNFTHRLMDSGAENTQLVTCYNEAVMKLSTFITDVSFETSEIGIQSGEIAKASEDLAKRTEKSATQLEQGSLTLAQVDTRLQQTAEEAQKTAARASSTLTEVQQGRRVAKDAVAAMERVQTSAAGIATVIGGLDKIAFQTRVLAMNAAIEASRAGEAGRGFSVVADLVNSLAKRAKDEADSARQQLKTADVDIREAVSAVNEMDCALGSISGGMSEVSDLLSTIAEDNRAQSVAISSASAVIRVLDTTTQQNAATAEQAAAASVHLHDNVSSLISLARLFKSDPKNEAAVLTRFGTEHLTTKSSIPSAKPVKPKSSSGSDALVKAKNVAEASVSPLSIKPKPMPAAPNVVPLKGTATIEGIKSDVSKPTTLKTVASKPAVTSKAVQEQAPPAKPLTRSQLISEQASLVKTPAVSKVAGPIEAALQPTHANVTGDDDWQDF